MSQIWCSPGARWRFVVTDYVLAAFDSQSGPEVATAVAAASRPDVTFEELVALVPLSDLGHDSFVIVLGSFGADIKPATSPGDVSAIARGSAAVDVSSIAGMRRFSAAGSIPWMLADFSDVFGVNLVAEDQLQPGILKPPPAAVAMGPGILLGDALLWLNDEPPDFSFSKTHQLPARGGGFPSPDDERRMPLPRRTVADDPELTSSGWFYTGPVRRAQAETAPFGLRFTDGRVIDVIGPVVVGRNPRSRQGDHLVTLVPVQSPNRLVSSTHVRFEPAFNMLTVIDEHSTNGTFVAPEGQEAQRLRSRERLTLAGAARVDLGDGIIIEVLPPAGG